MKKRLLTLVILGFISSLTIGLRSVADTGNFSESSLTIYKGVVLNLDKDKYWDEVSFGMKGGEPEDYYVYVNILDKQGRLIAVVDQFAVSGGPIKYYSFSLDGLELHQDFLLEIHFVDLTGNIPLGSISQQAFNPAAAPIVPEETVLIVRYP